MGAAMVGGLATSLSVETIVLRAQGLSLSQAMRTALNMSFLSMLAMEATESTVALVLIDGPFDASNPLCWAALVPSTMAGFIVPLPYNYYMLRRFGRSCH